MPDIPSAAALRRSGACVVLALLRPAVATACSPLRHSNLHENYTVYTQVRNLVRQTPYGL
jgi:hypothetical protein